MTNFRLFFILFTLIFYSCSKKNLLHPELKRRAVVAIKLQPVFVQPIEKTNYFALRIDYILNNGKKLTTLSSVQKYNNEILDSLPQGLTEHFNFKVEHGVFRNGKICFNKNQISEANHWVKVKVSDPLGIAADSIVVDVPYLTDLKVTHHHMFSIIQGTNLQLNLEAKYSNNKTINYPNEKQYFSTENIVVRVNGEEISPPYMYTLPVTPIFYGEISVQSYLKNNPLIKDSILIPVQYDGNYTFEFNGQSGADGDDGEWFRGTNMNNGRDGSPGRNGRNGRKMTLIKVYVHSFMHHNDTILKAVIHAQDETQSCLYHANKGRLRIVSRGGRGGNGGDGGRGANGADETAKNNAGYGGIGGSGGDGGDGGAGGDVIIYGDSTSSPFLSNILVDAPGGWGGAGGKGGRNGYDGNKTNSSLGDSVIGLLNALLPGRGVSGMDGAQGESGGDVQIEILPSKRIKKMMQAVGY